MFEVTAHTLWFGFQYDSETVKEGGVGNGALATVRWYDGEAVPETEAGRASRRPARAAHSDR